MRISQCVPKGDLVTLSLDVIQDSWIWLTHKSGQSIVVPLAIGRYASILRRKDVTIVCMRPSNHTCCHCHWLTRDAAAKSLPLPLSLATKLLAQIGRLLAAVGCRTEIQADDISSCICTIYRLLTGILTIISYALFASARCSQANMKSGRSVCVWLSCGGGGRHFTRPQKHTFLSSARKMKPRRVGASAGRVVESVHPGTMEQQFRRRGNSTDSFFSFLSLQLLSTLQLPAFSTFSFYRQ